MSGKLLGLITMIMGSIILGAVIEKLFGYRLTKAAEKSRSYIDDAIVGAFKGMILLWCTLAGLYFALLWNFGYADWMNQAARVLVSIAIISVTLVGMKLTTGLISGYSHSSGGNLPSLSLFANLAKLLVFITGTLVLLQYLGISITPLLTALGVGGIAVALALQDTLSNIFAGIHILASTQIKPGDYIKLDSGAEGFVTDISWRNTSICTISNNMVLVPNSRLSTAIVTNYELPGHEMSILVNVGVSYSSDLEQVERIVIDTASELMQDGPGGVPEFEPVVRFQGFSDSSIDFIVILKTKSFTEQYMLKHEFIKKLHRRFNEENIEIPFPIRTIYLKNED